MRMFGNQQDSLASCVAMLYLYYNTYLNTLSKFCE